VDNVVQYGGLSEFDLASKLISFGVDRVLIFQSVKSVVTTQLKEKISPWL